jgi:hypothetical protein
MIVSQTNDTVDTKTQERFLAWVEKGQCDQKREDAVEALEYIRKIAGEK